jgi:hypothetical protein
MGPFMNFGALPLRQAPPGLMQGSLNAAQVAPNKLSIWDRLRQNPQMMGQMGMGMMQMGQRQPMGQAMNLGASLGKPNMMTMLQGLMQRRG